MAIYGESTVGTKVTISADAIHSTQVNVPIHISGHLFPLGFYSGVLNSDGSDIYVTDLSGNIWQHDLVEFNREANILRAIVRVPSFVSGQALEFMFQAGGTGTSVSQSDYFNAYENCYGGVEIGSWHIFNGTVVGRTNRQQTLTNGTPEYAQSPLGSGLYNTKMQDYGFNAWLEDYQQSQPFTIYCSASGIFNVHQSIAMASIYDQANVRIETDEFQINRAFYGGAADAWLTFPTSGREGFNDFAFVKSSNSFAITNLNVYKNAVGESTSIYQNENPSWPTNVDWDGEYLVDSQYIPELDTWVYSYERSRLTVDATSGIIDELWAVKKALTAEELRTYYYIKTSGDLLTYEYIDPVNPTGFIDYPVITVQPTGLILDEGQTATFMVVASGVGLDYQWRKNSIDISGAIYPELNVYNVNELDEGEYSVRVRNLYGSVYSNYAFLSINDVDTTTPVDPYSGLSWRFFDNSASIVTSESEYDTTKNIGNLYYKGYKIFSFKLGNIDDVPHTYTISVGGLNHNLYENLTFSHDKNNWEYELSGIYIDPRKTKVIWGKYTVEAVPVLTSGTLLIEVEETQ